MALGISDAQEQKMISDRAARNKQDPKHPYLINVKDGRILPNVPALAGRPARKTDSGHVEPAKAGHPDLRVYTGDPKASKEERLRWLQTNGVGTAAQRPVSLANVEPFDVGTATMDELVEFAQSEYGVDISRMKAQGLKAVRNEVIKLAKEAGAVADDDKLN